MAVPEEEEGLGSPVPPPPIDTFLEIIKGYFQPPSLHFESLVNWRSRVRIHYSLFYRHWYNLHAPLKPPPPPFIEAQTNRPSYQMVLHLSVFLFFVRSCSKISHNKDFWQIRFHHFSFAAERAKLFWKSSPVNFYKYYMVSFFRKSRSQTIIWHLGRPGYNAKLFGEEDITSLFTQRSCEPAGVLQSVAAWRTVSEK